MSSVLLRTSFTVLAALLGAVLGLTLGRAVQARLNLLLYAATGTLLAVVLCDILPDAKSTLSWFPFLLATAFGYVLFYLFDRYVSPICPACAFSEFDSGTVEKLGKTAVFLLLALGLHSMLDGLAIVIGDQINRQSNTGVLLALALHKLPEGLALTILLLAAGYTRRAALAWTSAIEMTTILGGVLGVVLFHHAALSSVGLLFAFVGGGFLFLIGSTLRTLWENKNRLFVRPLVLISGLTFACMASLLCVLRAYSS